MFVACGNAQYSHGPRMSPNCTINLGFVHSKICMKAIRRRKASTDRRKNLDRRTPDIRSSPLRARGFPAHRSDEPCCSDKLPLRGPSPSDSEIMKICQILQKDGVDSSFLGYNAVSLTAVPSRGHCPGFPWFDGSHSMTIPPKP